MSATPIEAREEAELIAELRQFIESYGVTYSSWCVGVTEEPLERLFGEHRVRLWNPWLCIPATRAEIAERVESYFKELGTVSAERSSGQPAPIVYAYLRFNHTRP